METRGRTGQIYYPTAEESVSKCLVIFCLFQGLSFFFNFDRLNVVFRTFSGIETELSRNLPLTRTRCAPPTTADRAS